MLFHGKRFERKLLEPEDWIQRLRYCLVSRKITTLSSNIADRSLTSGRKKKTIPF